MHEVLNVEASLPVASCSGCGRSVFLASYWPVTQVFGSGKCDAGLERGPQRIAAPAFECLRIK